MITSGMRRFLFLLTTLLAFQIQAQANETLAEDPIDRFLKAKSIKDLKAFSTHFGGEHYYWQKPSEFQTDPDLGYRHSSSTIVRHIKRTQKELIYDVQYSFDEFGRRIFPGHSPEGKSSFVILSGCSFTYGNGIDDDQTLSYFMNSQAQSRFVYNYGIGSSGTHMTLALTESDRFKKEIPQDNGTLVYVFIDGHIQRTNGFMNELGWLKESPCYEEQADGSFRRNGSFATCSPTRTWLLESLAELFKKLSIQRNFPSIRESHVQKTCQLIAQTNEAFKNQYSKGSFFVFLHPLSSENNYTKRIKACLNKKNISILEIDMSGRDSRDFTLRGDGHPNEKLNKMAAGPVLDYTRRLEEWQKKKAQ